MVLNHVALLLASGEVQEGDHELLVKRTREWVVEQMEHFGLEDKKKMLSLFDRRFGQNVTSTDSEDEDEDSDGPPPLEDG